MPRRAAPSTPERILDAAEALLQTRGYNGMSYADIAAVVGVTKTNLHHHFGSKAELGTAVMRRYVGRFYDALAHIDAAGGSARRRLAAYTALYEGVVLQRRICLCAVLAAEYDTLPRAMRKGAREFFADNEAWLTRTIRAGRAAGSLRPRVGARSAARMLLAGLEGALLIARPRGDPTGFRSLARALLASLRGGGAAAPSPPPARARARKAG